MHAAKCKKPLWKGYTLSDSNYKASWRRQNYADAKGVRGGQEGGVNGQRAEGVRYSDTIMVDRCRFTFIETHRTYTTKSDP